MLGTTNVVPWRKSTTGDSGKPYQSMLSLFYYILAQYFLRMSAVPQRVPNKACSYNVTSRLFVMQKAKNRS